MIGLKKQGFQHSLAAKCMESLHRSRGQPRATASGTTGRARPRLRAFTTLSSCLGLFPYSSVTLPGIRPPHLDAVPHRVPPLLVMHLTLW